MNRHAQIADQLRVRADQWIAATTPVYAAQSDGRLEGVGSGLFFEHRGRPFLITASHVLRDHIDETALLVGSPGIQIDQRHFVSPDENISDTGFVPLTDEQRAALRGVRYVTVVDIGPVERQPSIHTVIGYRADDNPVQEMDVVTPMWSAYSAMSAPTDTYETLGLLDTDRLLLNFDRRNLFGPDGPEQPEPEPEGLSGSGVWRMGKTGSADRLVAIMDGHGERGRLLYASGLTPLLRSLDDYVEGRLR